MTSTESEYLRRMSSRKDSNHCILYEIQDLEYSFNTIQRTTKNNLDKSNNLSSWQWLRDGEDKAMVGLGSDKELKTNRQLVELGWLC